MPIPILFTHDGPTPHFGKKEEIKGTRDCRTMVSEILSVLANRHTCTGQHLQKEQEDALWAQLVGQPRVPVSLHKVSLS